ncbi:MAG TPA: hypothetical protein VH763_04610 [Gemmatimonadales bacterium]|jgi:hypothetical protein
MTLPTGAEKPKAIDWGHFAGMLLLTATTASCWLLVYKLATRDQRGR